MKGVIQLMHLNRSCTYYIFVALILSSQGHVSTTYFTNKLEIETLNDY